MRFIFYYNSLNPKAFLKALKHSLFVSGFLVQLIKMANLITGTFYSMLWPYVKSSLQNLKECTTTENVFDALEELRKRDLNNVKYVVRGLKKFFNIVCKENSCFMSEKDFVKVIKYIAKLALKLEKLITSDDVKIIVQQQQEKYILNRMQAAALLSHSFLCIHPESHRSNYMPSVNFTGTFQVMEETEVEKIKCILNYFNMLSNENQKDLEKQLISYERVCLSQQQMYDWKKLQSSTKSLCNSEVDENSPIENSENTYAKVDFANMYLGGGVLNTGCLQEEIMFTSCPELICGMLFMEAMKDNEAIIIAGFKKYSNYSGYARALKYEDSNDDNNENSSKKPNVIVAMDALDFRDDGNTAQFTEQLMLREINKSFTAFHKFGTSENLEKLTKNANNNLNDNKSSDDESTKACCLNSTARQKKYGEILKLKYPEMIATGNWGCGAFLGDPQLKAMLQWIAASEAGCKSMLYCTLGHQDLHNLKYVTQQVKTNKATVGSLVRSLENVKSQKLPLFNIMLQEGQCLGTYV